MTLVELLKWQYVGYAKFHQSRANLLIHIVAVPLFLLGSMMLVLSLLMLAWVFTSIALILIIASIAIQGRGHGRETLPPEPFTGPMNVISRIFFEQWVTFPRFLFSGGWLLAWRSSARQRS